MLSVLQDQCRMADVIWKVESGTEHLIYNLYMIFGANSGILHTSVSLSVNCRREGQRISLLYNTLQYVNGSTTYIIKKWISLMHASISAVRTS